MFAWPNFFASLAVGLVGITVSVLSTIAYNSYAERRRLRVDCARQLFQYSLSDDAYFKAFNEVPIIFSKVPKVLAAHQRVLESKEIVGEPMSDFIVTVAEAIGMDGGSRHQLMSRWGMSKKN